MVIHGQGILNLCLRGRVGIIVDTDVASLFIVPQARLVIGILGLNAMGKLPIPVILNATDVDSVVHHLDGQLLHHGRHRLEILNRNVVVEYISSRRSSTRVSRLCDEQHTKDILR